MGARLQLRRRAATLIVASALQMVTACSRTPQPGSRQQSLEVPAGKRMTAAALQAQPPGCPPGGSPELLPSPLTGHHTVTLSWNPSAPSANNAAGYCLYRSKKRNVAAKNPTCPDCEQINAIPVAGTACVDNLVQDGATYYYVAAAISQGGQLSSSSNEITVVIPPNSQAAASRPSVSYPFCRAAASSK